MKNTTKKIRYVVDEARRKHFPEPMFTVKQVVIVNQEEVEKYRKRNNGRLPAHVRAVEVEDED